jgi:lysozyme
MDPAQLAFLLVAQFEGYRDKPYQDQGGTWTIGFGRTGPDVGPHTVTTKDTETAWVKQRLAWLQQRIDHDAGRDLNANQMAALIDFAYNLGLGALQRSTLWHCVQDGQWAPAASAILLYDKVRTPGGTLVTDRGLIARRKAERDLFLAEPAKVLA